ncbi:hypothetical protein ORJ00_02455 [Rheinheimera baltica]|uniref:hypothetical protein n=1 Tax=Rheinheimera baltica TaxID=67576 RepID=UPI00273F1FD1|nr:hypothetical protein [Rheinheimera baltica]MDP5141600.1 hypothetical protein [Rheinheimera baltica]
MRSVRSASTSPDAHKTDGTVDIRWADVILVMEQKHKNRLAAEFSRLLDGKPIHELDIPDDYKYIAPELVSILQDSVAAYLVR